MCLRIVAPAAAHGASFEKHRGTHTRSVMYGKPLNISHEQCRLFVLLFLFHRHIVCHIVGPIKKMIVERNQVVVYGSVSSFYVGAKDQSQVFGISSFSSVCTTRCTFVTAPLCASRSNSAPCKTMLSCTVRKRTGSLLRNF